MASEKVFTRSIPLSYTTTLYSHEVCAAASTGRKKSVGKAFETDR